MAGGVYRPACIVQLMVAVRKKETFGYGNSIYLTFHCFNFESENQRLIAQRVRVDDCKTVRLWVSNRETYYLVAHTTGFILTLFFIKPE